MAATWDGCSSRRDYISVPGQVRPKETSPDEMSMAVVDFGEVRKRRLMAREGSTNENLCGRRDKRKGQRREIIDDRVQFVGTTCKSALEVVFIQLDIGFELVAQTVERAQLYFLV